MQDLTVTLIQSPLYWQDVDANLAMFEEKIWTIQGQTDLIVLPEMFNTGFTMDVETCSEPMNFTTFKWMKQMAAQTRAVVTGSFIVKEDGNFFNRLIWMQPSGEYRHYDKRHLFRMANEHDHYSAGNHRLIVDLKGWKVCPMICYDLRFPIWSRNDLNPDNQYDLLLYVANWPTPRINAWDTLLQARAIENIAYVIGVNRIGTDINNNLYNGHSIIINHKGEQLFFNEGEELLETKTLIGEQLKTFREKFPAHLDADQFTIK